MRRGHQFSIAAAIIGIMALSAAIAGKIFAQGTFSETYSNVVCSFVEGEWSECVNGKQTRSIIKTPTGCYVPENITIPATSRTCSTITTTPTPCTYLYSNWSACTSYGKKTRTVTSITPSGCVKVAEPVLQESCSPNNEMTSCSYVYGEWSTCTASGYQTRALLEKNPSGCNETTAPILSRSCVNQETLTSCSYSYSDWSVCLNGKQTRTIKSKYPLGCVDSAIPVLEQTCNGSNSGSSTSDSTQTIYKINVPVVDLTPAVGLNFGEGIVITDEFTLETKVKYAVKVEWYSLQTNSNIPKYIGSAEKVSDEIWKYKLDPKKFPNGSYQLKVLVKNAYGSYDGAKKTVVIMNPVVEIPAESINSQNSTKTENNEGDFNGNTSSDWQNKYFGNAVCTRESICGANTDLDKDGLVNNEEFRLGTDPKNPDTDLDGFIDGDEIKGGFNPALASPGDGSDKIVFENPKDIGEIKKDLFKVENVEFVKTEGNGKVKLSGKAIPNAFVTVYIFSDPIILTVKTDSEGNWEYELDKDLEDGDHQAYVAVTDNTGKITGKSEPIAFVKTAQAVTVVSAAQTSDAQKASPTSLWYKNSIIFFAAIALGAVALTLAIIGIILHKKAEA